MARHKRQRKNNNKASTGKKPATNGEPNKLRKRANNDATSTHSNNSSTLSLVSTYAIMPTEDNSASSSICSTSVASFTKSKVITTAPHHSGRGDGRVQRQKSLLHPLTIVGCLWLLIAFYYCYLGYLKTRLTTTFDTYKIVNSCVVDDPERFWGSYRPLNYFGMRARHPNSLVMGLMWYTPKNLDYDGNGIRHWCNSNDNISKFGWLQHDGRSFGIQKIQDSPYELKTSFVKFRTDKKNSDWTARISVRNTSEADCNISLIWYVALEQHAIGQIKYQSKDKSVKSAVLGDIQALGKFQLHLHPIEGRILHESYLSTRYYSLSTLTETISTYLLDTEFRGLPGKISSLNNFKDPNFIAIQLTVESNFTLDITYQSVLSDDNDIQLPKPQFGEEYTVELKKKLHEFDRRFENTFQLRNKGFAASSIQFAQYALSNMLGSIGYFYGASQVKSKYTKAAVFYWDAGLYTTVPARSTFSHGFLWDEGFHGILVSSWDIDIELDIMSHWFDLMNIEGWIPCEQILGEESLSKVPAEFIIQDNTNVCPPTFFLTLKKILKYHKKELITKNRFDILDRLYPRLQAWYAWHNKTQHYNLAEAYQLAAPIKLQINPMKSPFPIRNTNLVNYRCWMAFASSVMSELSALLGKRDIKYYRAATYLSHDHFLTNQPSNCNGMPAEEIFGSFNLCPFLLGLVHHNSPSLAKTLHQIRNSTFLWTDFGIRTLANPSSLYWLRNIEYPPYWHNSVWLDLNYLILKALHHYAELEGPCADLSRAIYQELRNNIVRNIINEYERTGFIWERYDEINGYGKGASTFKSSASLIVAIMAEHY